MGTPHKHAAVIKAWADGADVQHRKTIRSEWHDTWAPSFHHEFEYRVKPVPHKWQNEMDAFNDGKVIQCRSPHVQGWQDYKKESGLCTSLSWCTDKGWEYRIKPANVARDVHVTIADDGSVHVKTGEHTPNLRLVFNDGVLILAAFL